MDRKGLVGLAKFGLVVCFIASVLALSTFNFISVMSFQSLNGTFNVTEITALMNWTGPANITAHIFANNTRIEVANSSTWIYGTYWQNDSFYAATSYSNLSTITINYCFKDGSVTGSMGFAALNNITGNAISLNISNFTAGYYANSTLFNLSAYQICPPGKYYGNFSVRDASNTSEHANVTATIIIPLSEQNTINTTGWNYTGFVHGKMPPNMTYYHSYYFNPDIITNATGLTINISGFNQTLGAYLVLPNGTVLAQAENSSNIELVTPLNGSILSNPSKMLELRIYGNFSDSSLQTYHANFYFSTINITNATADGPASLLDFGATTPNISSVPQNFTLTNVGGINLSDINQTADFYWTKQWLSNTGDQAQNGTQSNLSFIVPNFTTQIEVTLQWRNVSLNLTNASKWDLFLVSPSGRIVANSTTNYLNSNFTNATVTEKIIYSGNVFNTSNTGFWNITVNASTVNGSRLQNQNITIYNVTVKLWFNTTNTTTWIRTNFTEVYPFNQLVRSGLANASRVVSANITVPLTQLINGTYEGYIQYSNAGASGAGWKVRIPIKFQINVPMLVMNNSIYNTTIRIEENTGFHRKRQINISLSNLGSSSLIYALNRSYNLSLGSSFINITLDSNSSTNESGGMIAPGENRSINLTLYINTSNTGNTQGLYTGWITFNTTQNNTNNISIHNIFNVSIEVNLTNNLVVNITEYITSSAITDVATASKYNPFVNVTGTTQNITIIANVSLQNGTVLSDSDLYSMNETNFTSVTMVESNTTTYSVTLTNIRDGGGGTTCKPDGFCMINATIPANVSGGRYNLSITAQFNSTESINATPVVLSGSGGIYPLTVWAPGLKLTSINTSVDISMGEYIDVYLNVSIINYGPKTADSGIISLNNSCSYVVVNASSYGNYNGTCSLSAVTGNNHFTISSILGNGSGCWAAFKVHSVNVSGAKSCSSGSINVSTTAPFFNYLNTYIIAIGDTDGSAGGTGATTGGTTTPTYTYNRSVQLLSYNTAYTAKLGENISAAVTVKNTGNTTSIVWLTATTNNSAINTSVAPSFASMGIGNTTSFTVYMNVSNSSRLGLFSGTFKAYVEGYADTWYHSKSFDITVEATYEKKAEINVSYANYTAQLENLTNIFNAIKASGFADIGNLTKVEILFNETTELVERIKAAINSSNYAAAEALMLELASNINRIQTEMATLQASKAGGEQRFMGDVITWIVIGLVIAGAAGVVIYMLLPPKQGYRRIRGFRPFPSKPSKPQKSEQGGTIKKIGGMLKRKEKGSAGKGKSKGSEDSSVSEYAEMKNGKIEYLTSKYAEGYERALAKKGKRHTAGGAISRIKSLFKRSPKKKQEKLSDFAKK